MTYRLIALGLVASFMPGLAVADGASISLANGTDHVFTSVTISALDQDVTLGASIKPLRPGQSVTIPLKGVECQTVDVFAVYETDKMISTIADACDPAIYTLTY